jgi:NAD-dependent SIR2 family protein deacetylase
MFSKELQGSIDSAARAILTADALIITAGAGMGVDSGLPDYRGNEGLWRAYPRLKHLGLSFEEAANPAWFGKDPKLAWAFYGHRQALYRQTKPHRGFALLKEWGEAKPDGHFTYTSNVDGQFQCAGYDPQRLVECHGNIHRYQCCEPCNERIWQDTSEDLDIDMETFEARGPLPRCPECGGIARPNVLMFYDWDWLGSFRIEQERRLRNWVDMLLTKDASVAIVELGAGKSLAAIRNASERLTRQLNGKLVRINPRDAEGPKGAISIALPALEALERIERSLSKRY